MVIAWLYLESKLEPGWDKCQYNPSLALLIHRSNFILVHSLDFGYCWMLNLVWCCLSWTTVAQVCLYIHWYHSAKYSARKQRKIVVRSCTTAVSRCSTSSASALVNIKPIRSNLCARQRDKEVESNEELALHVARKEYGHPAVLTRTSFGIENIGCYVANCETVGLSENNTYMPAFRNFASSPSSLSNNQVVSSW